MSLKKYKPTSPGRRGLVLVDRSALWKGRPVKELTEGLQKSGGRNNHGQQATEGEPVAVSASFVDDDRHVVVGRLSRIRDHVTCRLAATS